MHKIKIEVSDKESLEELPEKLDDIASFLVDAFMTKLDKEKNPSDIFKRFFGEMSSSFEGYLFDSESDKQIVEMLQNPNMRPLSRDLIHSVIVDSFTQEKVSTLSVFRTIMQVALLEDVSDIKIEQENNFIFISSDRKIDQSIVKQAVDLLINGTFFMHNYD